MSRQSHLVVKQTATSIQPNALPQREPVLEMERIISVDFTPTQAQGKELAALVHRGWTQAEATVAKSLSMPPPLTDDGVDRIYHQLA
jgi:hypothetical protein